LVFYLWARQFETGVSHPLISRPPGVEGWLPIAGMMSLKFWLVTRHVPAIHPATLVLLLTFLAIAFFFRKAFCSWLCPVGTFSEYLWRAGRKIFKRNFRIWKWLDVSLRGLKYLLLGFFVWAVSSMSAAAIASFMRSDYGVVADVKMLNFFRYLGATGATVILLMMIASLFIQNFWCRYLCPCGALLGLVSLLSPVRVRRNSAACIDCAKCAKACPSALPVDTLITIKSAECTGCLECIAACPAEGALDLAALPLHVSTHRRIPVWAMAAGVAAIFFGVVGCAKLSGRWNSDVPDSTYHLLVPHANEARHPMPGDPGLAD
jgi:polyferredoxin